MNFQQPVSTTTNITKVTNKTKIILGILGIISFAAIFSILILINDNSSNNKIVATIDTKQITLSDLINKNKIETAYMGSEYVGKQVIENYKILYKLLQEKTMELVAEKYKINISQEELDKEYNRMKKESLRPDLLQQIEQTLDNKKIFINLIVRPIVIQNKLLDFYESKLTELDPAFKKMNELLAKAQNDPTLFKSYDNIELRRFFIPKNKPAGTNDIKNYLGASYEGDYRVLYDDQLIPKIESLEPNKILNEVYYPSQSSYYALIRLDAIEEGGFKISKLLYSKTSFYQWIDSEVPNLGKAIIIKDSGIKEEIRKNYSNTALSSIIAY